MDEVRSSSLLRSPTITVSSTSLITGRTCGLRISNNVIFLQRLSINSFTKCCPRNPDAPIIKADCIFKL